MLSRFRLFLLLIVLSQAVLAQMDPAAHVMEMKDEIPPDKLPAPIRMQGIGNAHMQITGTREAQVWFAQGLNLLHDFWDYESARAFEQAVRVDPNCAMCYWGLYKAESFYHSTAQGLAGRALAQAVALKSRVSERERLYIDAADEQERARHGRGGSVSQAQTLLRKIVADFPQDLQARILLANSGVGDSRAILEAVLKDDPENSAANHYYIHALEGSDHPEKALHSADILGRLAPASGHMVHMPGHIYFRVGAYARAAKSFADALAVDERYIREQHVAADDNWNYVHNLMYSIANLLEQGRFADATLLSHKITDARGTLETTLYIYSARDSISRLSPELPVAMRTADYAHILKLVNAASVGPNHPNLEFLRQRLADFALGMQAVAVKNFAAAEQVSTRLAEELEHASNQPSRSTAMPGMPMTQPAKDSWPKLTVRADALLDPLLKMLSITSLELRGSISAARGKQDDAAALFRNAAAQEKALGYREPPNYIRPVGETEGAAMLEAGQSSAAKAAFERALAERPHSGFALYGIALSCEKSGDRAAADKTYNDFLAAWKDADRTLPQIAHAHAYLRAAQ
ncbi:MAG TPA: tetratricopeptide repeat protein [Bryobacteraceae bacterium]|nr:tetratricopeptide repeat protein [Bryobacteraceae bacterium]